MARIRKENAREIYNYFAKSLFEKRLFEHQPEERQKAQEALSHLESPYDANDINTLCVELKSWVDAYVSSDKWKRCLATLRQIKSCQKHDVKSIKLNSEIYNRLKEYAEQNNLSIQKAICDVVNFKVYNQDSNQKSPKTEVAKNSLNDGSNLTLNPSNMTYIQQWSKERESTPELVLAYLIEQEAERLLLLKEDSWIDENKSSPHLKIITELCFQSLGALNHENEISQVKSNIEELYKILLKKKLLSTKTNSPSIVESRRISVTHTHYYYFASVLAKYVARWFGTFDIYLNVGFCPEQAVMFIGMPSNVAVSETVFELLYKLFCQMKSNYKRDDKPKKSKKDNLIDMYLYRLAQQLEYTKAWIGDEKDFSHLFDYVKKKYPYALQ